MTQTRIKILKVAAKLVQNGGYSAASFREIAKAINVKSASIHYHYPTKADLGAALVTYDTELWLENLGDADSASPTELFEAAISLSRLAVTGQPASIACIFATELPGLPKQVAEATEQAQAMRIDWMAEVYRGMGMASGEAPVWGAATLATLDGAMMLARSQKDPALFDAIIDTIR